jgi:hypothetical protein
MRACLAFGVILSCCADVWFYGGGERYQDKEEPGQRRLRAHIREMTERKRYEIRWRYARKLVTGSISKS